MGKPGWGHAQSLWSEHIGPVEATRGTETSQYSEERKAISDSLSSGERRGISLNRYSVIARWRCCVGVVGPICLHTGAGEELQKRRLVEPVWKVRPK
jgi:hypothetical protein